MMMRLVLSMALAGLVLAVPSGAGVQAEPAWDPGPTLEMVARLHRLSDRFGSEVWPGFSTRKTPIAINHADKQELLFGHPAPPKEYRLLEPAGAGVLIRDGVSLYSPGEGGLTTDINGVNTAYVAVPGEGKIGEEWLSTLLHECFHVYQKQVQDRGDEPAAESPVLDSAYSAWLGLERRILHAALAKGGLSREEAGRRARMFLAARRARRASLPPEVARTEDFEEFKEGTAEYAEARMAQVRAGEGAGPEASEAAERFKKSIAGILPPDGEVIDFTLSSYQLGMAQALLLDLARPGWKEEMRAKAMTQASLLEREFPADPRKDRRLLADAVKEFDYAALLREQKELVEKQEVVLEKFLNAPGRRYRVFYGAVPSPLNWKPVTPVHVVPPDIAPAYLSVLPGRSGKREEAYIWEGGIEAFDQSSLHLRAKGVPVIFGSASLEWIDPKPALDGSELSIRSDRAKDGVHEGLRMRVGGVELEADRALVRVTDGVVEVTPLP
ncbi:MAG: hypothetical protein WC943_01425 [Elusimicrobiota bacterium]|jgi:hypothetical protein